MKILNRVLFSLLILIFYSCRKEATVWNSDWSIPIISDTLDLKNLVNDTTLSIDNGNYYVSLKRNLFHFNPSEIIEIPDTSIQKSYAISLSSIVVPPGASFVNDNKDHIFDMKDAFIKNARIKSGEIFIEITNPLTTAIDIQIELTKVKFDGQKLVKSAHIPPKSGNIEGKSSMTIDLKGYWIDLSGSNGYSSNALVSKIVANTDPNGNNVTITNLDSTRFNLQFKNLKFDYARGYFGKHNFTDTFTFVSKWLNENIDGTVSLPQLSCKFDIKNNIKALSRVNIQKVSNFNSSIMNTTYLSNNQIGSPFYIELPTGNWDNLQTTEKIIELNSQNSNIENFIENLGEKTEIQYSIDINPNGNTSGNWDEFFPQSELSVDFQLDLPLAFGLSDFIIADTFDVNLTQKYDKTHIESVNFKFEIENAFPIDGELFIIFFDESKQIIYEDKTIHNVKSSKNGNNTIYGIPSNKSEFTYLLPSDVLNSIEKIKYISVMLKLNSEKINNVNEPINIPENAFFSVKVKSDMLIKNIMN